LQRVARFHLVSLDQFQMDMRKHFPEMDSHEIQDIYENIQLPKRATTGSAGYDFFAPIDIVLKANETILIPTGIRVAMVPGWVLKCYPRSGLGFKYRMQLNNTVGIIDGDYFNADNEGHILVKVTNDSNEDKVLHIKCGEGFIQGIFIEYGIAYDDEVEGLRTGGLGSTTV